MHRLLIAALLAAAMICAIVGTLTLMDLLAFDWPAVSAAPAQDVVVHVR